MATYHLTGQILKRSQGHSSVAAASYRARTSLVDERTGLEHSYTSIAKDLLFEGVFVDAKAPAWARDRAKVWNRIEQVEDQKNSQLCHELNIALPHELTPEQNRWALQDWAKELTRKGYVVDIVIHAAHDYGDERNIHAHVMIPLRKIDRAANDFSKDKDRYSLAELGMQMNRWREQWAHHANRALARAGHDVTIDHRSLEAQGSDRLATVHLGKDAAALERRGIATDRGDQNRHALLTNIERERVQAEIAELERLYALEDEQKRDIARHLAGWTEGRAKDAQLKPVIVESAIDRFRREDEEQRIEAARQVLEEERIANRKLMHEHRGIMGALWSLARTAGASLAHVLMGANIADLARGRYVDTGLGPKPAPVEDIAFAGMDAGGIHSNVRMIREEKRARDRKQEQIDKRIFVDRDAQARPAPFKALLQETRSHDQAERAAMDAEAARRTAEREEWLEQKRQEAEAIEPPPPRQEDFMDRIRREQMERMRQLAKEIPRRDRSHELDRDELDLDL